MLSPTDRLRDARLYLCTDARSERGDLAEFVQAALAGGVDVVQLRDKTLKGGALQDAVSVVADQCSAAEALWCVNDDPQLAAAAAAPLLHLGQDDMPVPMARDIVGSDVVVGRSTHSFDQATAAATQSGVGSFAVGPIWATPTKPGRPGIGLEVLKQLTAWEATAQSCPPWFAIGGIDQANVEQVRDAGARRIVVVRAITEAADPTHAAQQLRSAITET